MLLEEGVCFDYTVEVRNPFKGLGLIDRVPDELCMEVRDIAQETGIKTIPMEKKCKEEKWLSGEPLQIAVKRREAKSKGEKERYTHLNAEFQTTARRDTKAFLSNQCKERQGGQVDRGQETGPFLHPKIKYDSFTLEKRSSGAQASSSVRSLQRGKGVSRRLL